ncbi:MAG TPA: DUF3738 domain-containing protein, partial [Vicinamibacterales bacterium]|nr:DUF3738 domain-containing protein [Vicinamibacterales bacterium]
RQVPDACAAALKALTGAAPLPQRSGPPPCSFGGPPGRLIGTGVTIAMFASVLSGNAGRTVSDRTGLAGSFDTELRSVVDGSIATRRATRSRLTTASRRSSLRCRNNSD